MRKGHNAYAVDLIAETGAELAGLAGSLGLEFIVFILRVAELEARQSLEPPQAQKKLTERRVSMH